MCVRTLRTSSWQVGLTERYYIDGLSEAVANPNNPNPEP